MLQGTLSAVCKGGVKPLIYIAFHYTAVGLWLQLVQLVFNSIE